MFTNLIGFIKPLIKKDTTTTKTISPTRKVGDDAPTFKHFEDEAEVIVDTDQENRSTSQSAAGDTIDLSLAAMRHLVEQADAPLEEKDAALRKIHELEAQGLSHIAMPAGTSVVSFLNSLE